MGSLRYGTKALLCAVVSAQTPLPYQSSYREHALEALRTFYAMNFPRAEQLLSKLDSLFGLYVGTSYLRALAYSWRIELDPSTTWFDSFWERELQRTDSLLRCCASHPLEKYFIGFANKALEVRRLYVRGQLIPSVWKARELIGLLDGIRRYADAYPEMQFELGLYEYYIDYFSQNYPIMRPILYFFPKGNERSGLLRLERCARDSLNYTQYEAAYFLGYIYLYQAKRPAQAVYWLSQLSERFPANPLFRRMWAEALYQTGRYQEAREAIRPWIEAYERACSRPPCYLITGSYPTSEAVQSYGLLGMSFREEKRYAEAQAAFARMDSLLKTLRLFPAPTWARLMREAAILEKQRGDTRAAEARLRAIRERDDVPAYLKAPLP
ncbi:MAG: tetratricopeptide repeat protein [Bacteroidia bacterium]|nr:tetratricopeptide repeat protein [Bacteroidia bacterium]